MTFSTHTSIYFGVLRLCLLWLNNSHNFFIFVLGKLIGVKLDWSLVDEAITEDCNEEEKDLAYRKSVRCKVFLGFTSNLISSGIRDIVRYLVQHHMVSFFCVRACSREFGCSSLDFVL